MKKAPWILSASLTLLIGIGLFYHFFDSGIQGNLELKPYISDKSLEQPVISINQQPISVGMLMEEVRKKGGHIPGRFDNDEQRQKVIDELIHFELLAQEAKKLNYPNDPEIRLAYKKLLVAKFKREQIQTQLSEIIITDSEIKSYYKDHIESYKESAMYRVAMIFLRKPDSQKKTDLKKQKKTMGQIRQMAKRQTGSDFGKLAAKYSDDVQSKYKGGALPWLSEKSRYFRLEPAIIKAAFKLRKKSEISQPIETKNGFYLLKLIDKRQEQIKPMAAVRLQIQADLKASLKQKWLDGFYKKLRKNAEIHANDSLLSEDVIWKNQGSKGSQVPRFPAR